MPSLMSACTLTVAEAAREKTSWSSADQVRCAAVMKPVLPAPCITFMTLTPCHGPCSGWKGRYLVFLTADYAFGQALEEHHGRSSNANGGKVLRGHAPYSTPQDFSAFTEGSDLTKVVAWPMRVCHDQGCRRDFKTDHGKQKLSPACWSM
jgi:hypothetical protein